MLGWGRQLSREAVDAAAASGLQPRPRSGHERHDLRGRPFGSGRKAAPNGASDSGRRRASKKPKLDSIDEDGEPSEEQIQRLLAEAQNWGDKEDEMKASLLRNMPSLDVARLRAAEAEINAARTRLQQSFWPHKCCLPLFAAADAINELEPREQARARAFESCTSSSVDGATPSLRITETGNHAEVVYQGVLLAAVLPVPEFHCSCCSEVWYPDAPTLLCFPSSPTGIKLDGATSGYTRWIALAVLDNFHRLSNGGGVSAQAYAAFLEETQRETAACGAYLGGSLGALKFHKFDDKLLLNAYFAHRRLIVPLADERDMGITFKDGALQDCSACSTVIVDGEPSFNEHATIMLDGSYTPRANKGGAKAAIAAEERSGTGLRTIGRYFAPGPNREVAAAAPAVRRAAPKSRFNARHNRIRACRQFSEEPAPTRAASAFGIGGAVCPEGVPARWSYINMRRPENWRMYDAMLRKLIANNQLDAIKVVYLDFGCMYQVHFVDEFGRAGEFTVNAKAEEIKFFVDWLHAKGHHPECRYSNGAMYVLNTGRRIGAQCEELWAKVTPRVEHV